MAVPDTDLPDWAKDDPAVGGGAPAPNDAPAPMVMAQKGDDSLPSWVKEAGTPAAGPTRKPASQPHGGNSGPPSRAAPQTRFQQSGTPPPKAVPEPSWSQVGQQAWQNLPSSALGAGQAMWHAIRHPIQTGQAIGQLGAGVLSQAQGALGMQQDPAEKARTEALAKAVEGHYANAYGSVKGFKNAVSTDPVSVLTDAASVLTGGEGLAAKVPGLERAAALAGKVGSAIDPVQNAVRVAKVAAKPVVAAARGASSIGTGVPASLMKVAANAGKTTDPALRDAFLKFYTGQGDPAEYLSRAQGALGQLRQDASDAYLAKKSTLANVNPSFQPIDDALAKARAETMAGGVNVGQFKAANDALDQAEAMVNGWKAAPDPSYQSLLGFDNLKQAIWDLRDSTNNSVAQKHLGGLYNGVKDAIIAADPEYAKLMEGYQLGRNAINDTQRTLMGAGKNPAATTAMAKSLRALKTATGKNIFAQLAEKDPSLPYMLAGNALAPWGAGGKAGLFEGMALPMAGLTGVIAHNPMLGAGQLASQVALQSPKMAGALSFATGVGERLASPAAKADYYAGRIGQEGEPGEVNIPPAAVEALQGPNGTFQRMLAQESGNHQFGADGSLVTSGKGAMGAAQIMPATGPEAAALAGLPWDPERLKSDPDYNRALGLAYFKHQIDTFGDEAKAVAAYNAGPGRVRQAELIASERGGNWLDYVPAETRAYVHAVLSGEQRVARASGGRVDTSRRDELVEKLLKTAEQAKRAGKKHTEPLLTLPDDAVAKALAVANRAI